MGGDLIGQDLGTGDVNSVNLSDDIPCHHILGCEIRGGINILNAKAHRQAPHGRNSLIDHIPLHAERRTAAQATQTTQTEKPQRSRSLWLIVVMIAGGLAGLIFGGELFLDSASAIARALGLSESVIAITLVAGGTSLPELASSVVSLLKGKSEMALGNVIGSNIANILLILGLSATIHPLTLGGITRIDLLTVLLSSVLLFVTAFTFRRKAVDRWEGAIFLVIYALYIGYLVR